MRCNNVASDCIVWKRDTNVFEFEFQAKIEALWGIKIQINDTPVWKIHQHYHIVKMKLW